MKKLGFIYMLGILSIGGAAQTAAADYHCSEERSEPSSRGIRRLFVWVDQASNECTVGEEGEGFLPARIIDQVECTSDEVAVRIDEKTARRNDDGAIEYRSDVRLRWDDQGAKPIFKNYVFYCRIGE